MKIETKFSIGDSVWVMHMGKPCSFKVCCIRTESGNSPFGHYTIVRYATSCDDIGFCEPQCYSTKEELLASL